MAARSQTLVSNFALSDIKDIDEATATARSISNAGLKFERLVLGNSCRTERFLNDSFALITTSGVWRGIQKFNPFLWYLAVVLLLGLDTVGMSSKLACRNVTRRFENFRANSRVKRPFVLNEGADGPLLLGSTSSSDHAVNIDMAVIPPQWVDIVERVQRSSKQIKEHRRLLSPDLLFSFLIDIKQ